jgi:oligoribonuclease
MSGEDRFIWCDIETSGLIPETGLILEIGFIITDTEFNEIDANAWTVWDTPTYDDFKFDSFILNMHGDTGSGLITDARGSGWTLKDVKEDVLTWLHGHGIKNNKEPMCGSSVHFDQMWLLHHMPEVANQFHYRHIDTSTVKELCRRLNPSLYAKLDKYTTKRELHRVLPDLEDTISEAKFYSENFLIVGD